ncbi:hypothetical protein JAO73_10615 [Hymenobacter sp. BT523]|uniref:hypothetical protein n=1 Tax=Hymenobacter sp. BT523 TaxID=2795725 RepID=UPI0018EABC71|nr:hypothetical protein [Hymenobacter sp. BT523]MBJ6109468.1 hypothetical protein [Hymenobacter sp. BT523]
MKNCLLLFALFGAAPLAHAQQEKSLTGKAKADSLSAEIRWESERIRESMLLRTKYAKTPDAGGNAKLEAKNGFRTFRLGDDISKYPLLVKRAEVGELKYYRNPNENRQIVKKQAKYITYCFYKGKLYHVKIQMAEKEDSEDLLMSFVLEYGNASFSHKQLPWFYWYSNPATIAFNSHSTKSTAEAIIFSNAIYTQKANDAEEVGK